MSQSAIKPCNSRVAESISECTGIAHQRKEKKMLLRDEDDVDSTNKSVRIFFFWSFSCVHVLVHFVLIYFVYSYDFFFFIYFFLLLIVRRRA